MRGARAGDLGRVLHRLHQRDRIGAARRPCRPRRAISARERIGARSRGRGALPPSRRRALRGRPSNALGLAHIGERLEIVAHLVGELAAVDVERRRALRAARSRRPSGSGVCATSAPRMLKVQATLCGSDTTSASAFSLAISAWMRASFVGARLAGEFLRRAATTRPERRGRAVGPDRVDRVGVDRHERRAGAARRPWRASRRRRRCAATGRSRSARRPAGWLSSQLSGGLSTRCSTANTRGVDLVAHLQRVAPVDEDRRAVGEHDRGAGRAGEAGQPGEPLLGRRHVFVLMPVGARHDEAVEAAPLQLGAQRRDARPRSAARSVKSSNVWKRASNMRGNLLSDSRERQPAAAEQSAMKTSASKRFDAFVCSAAILCPGCPQNDHAG